MPVQYERIARAEGNALIKDKDQGKSEKSTH